MKVRKYKLYRFEITPCFHIAATLNKMAVSTMSMALTLSTLEDLLAQPDVLDYGLDGSSLRTSVQEVYAVYALRINKLSALQRVICEKDTKAFDVSQFIYDVFTCYVSGPSSVLLSHIMSSNVVQAMVKNDFFPVALLHNLRVDRPASDTADVAAVGAAGSQPPLHRPSEPRVTVCRPFISCLY